MTASTFFGKRVIAAGASIHAATVDALAGADLELVGADGLDSALRRGRPADLVVVDGDAAPQAALFAWLDGPARRPEAPAVILVGSRPPISVMRALMILRASDVLEAPASAQDLTFAALRLLEPAVRSTPSASRCLSVIGAVGGAGCTTVATELAAAATSLRPAPKVCLIDLNLADGAAAAYLGADPAMVLTSGLAPERIDAAVLSAFAAPTGDGFDLLACPRDMTAFDAVRPEVVIRVLDIASQVYDWVIVDLPRHRRAFTLDVVAGSDEVLVVSELTVPALLSAAALTREIEAELPDGPRPRIILNRVASRMFGPAPSLAEAERALGRAADCGIVSDWEAASAAVNLGGSIRRYRPKSKIVRDVDALIQKLAVAPARTGTETRAA